MIGAALKSHFCLIAIPYRPVPPALMLLGRMRHCNKYHPRPLYGLIQAAWMSLLAKSHIRW